VKHVRRQRQSLLVQAGRTERMVEQPRMLTVAVNRKVLRQLGLDYQPSDRAVVYR